MATPVTNPGPQGYWGVIQSAAFQKLTTAELWQAISDFEASQGITRPAGMFAAVSAMRALAVAQRVASTLLAKATGQQVIDASMIAQDINARPLNEQSIAPAYRVRYQATVITPEGPDTVWQTAMFRNYLPSTKEDLLNQITVTGAGTATGSGNVFTGLGDGLVITAI